VERLDLEYLRPETARQYDFYLMPKLLLDHKAFNSVDYGAKLLYSIMLSRASSSTTNVDVFTDEDERIYIIYTIEQVMKDMRCAKATAVKMLKQLDDIGLIEKKEIEQKEQGKSMVLDGYKINTIREVK